MLKVITIDGPAASGKSTTARLVARELEWNYIDTGAMYRALGLAALRDGKDPADLNSLHEIIQHVQVDLLPGSPIVVLLNGENVSEEIRLPEASDAASKISVHTPVRKKLVELQRKMGLERPSVLEGRDTGTVVFPDAGLKIFLKASVEVRANRRVLDYKQKGINLNPDDVRKDLQIRDNRDSSRDDSPLIAAEDAIILDTSELTIQGQVDMVLKYAKDRFGLE